MATGQNGPGRRSILVKPNCTHITMDRVHGHSRCDICHLLPSMGWLYVCRQDVIYPRIPPDPLDIGKRPRTTLLLQETLESMDDEDISPNAGNVIAAKMREISLKTIQSPLRAELEAVGLSESIIRQAEAGVYSKVQLERLKSQKLQVKNVIEIELKHDSTSLLSDSKVQTQAGEGQTKEAPKLIPHRLLQSRPCKFKCCHTCRRFYLDRIYLPFEAVLTEEVPPTQLVTIHELPISEPDPFESVPSQPHKEADRYDSLRDEEPLEPAAAPQRELKAWERLRNTPRRWGSKTWLHDGRNANEGDETDAKQEGLHTKDPQAICHTWPRRIMKRYFDLPKHDRRATWSVGSGHDHPSEDNIEAKGDNAELEVEGGIALTEEAVEMHTPDIITQA